MSIKPGETTAMSLTRAGTHAVNTQVALCPRCATKLLFVLHLAASEGWRSAWPGSEAVAMAGA